MGTEGIKSKARRYPRWQLVSDPTGRRPGGNNGYVNMAYHVYLIQSKKDKKYYIGQTNDIRKRLQAHNNGLVKATKNRIPFELIGYENYKTQNKARWREYNLKKSAWQRKKFVEKLKNDYKKNC